MKKRLVAILLAGVMVLSSTACSDEDWDEDWEEESTEEEKEEKEESGGKESSSSKEDSGDADSSSAMTRGLSMNVNRSGGGLQVNRAKGFDDADMGEEGVWTIFVYLCGTDLESGGGMGTGDIEEMLEADGSDQVRFVVQTGGASMWDNEMVDPDSLQRFVVQNEDIELVDEQSAASMGDMDTFSDFLDWGTQNYASEHMGVILWNHGGGSITGICFDEMYDFDSLDLTELDSAFYSVFQNIGRKFDFIGFDACLMGTVETANVLATYADYMYGSEESEPGSGWDYTVIGDFLAENPDADGAELGKVVCDSFLEACEEIGQSDITTLSVLDLNRMDDLLVSFNDFAMNMYNAGGEANARVQMVRAIESEDNFGGNNKSEGYTNMVDMGGLIDACADFADGADTVRAALDDVVVYSVTGSMHRGASGLSMYYPLSVQGSNELGLFSNVCVSPYYLSFVDRMNHGAASDLSYDDYDDEQWFDDEGDWSWGDYEYQDDDYWDYLDDYEQTGESPYISFEEEPQFDEEGMYYFVLDDEGYYNAASVTALVYEISADEEDLIELGETIDVMADWDYGVFTDNFDGYWLSLPDGQNLALYLVEETEDYVVYTSPIELNGVETNLRMLQYYDDGSVVIEGAWEGINEYGVAARDIVQLQDGDVIIPMYYAYSIEGDDEFYYYGAEYVVDGEPEIFYQMMESGDYLYSFCINDIYGDYLITDPVMFNIDEDGNVSFYED